MIARVGEKVPEKGRIDSDVPKTIRNLTDWHEHARLRKKVNQTAMFDVTREELCSIQQVAAFFKVTPKTVRSWIAKTDYKGRLKDRTLETVTVGGRLRTSWEAIQRFTNHERRPVALPPDVAAYLQRHQGIPA